MKLSVYATPNCVQEKELKDQVVVVIDVLRATSTIITALHNDCREVIPVIEIEEAVNMSRNYERDSFSLCGERNVQPIEGFHFSNSPLEYTREQIEGKTLILTTTNGTRAIRKTAEAREVAVCALINVDAVSEYLLELESDVIFMCAGTDGKFSLDDIVTAGAVISRIRQRNTDVELSDLAIVCAAMHDSCHGDLHGLLKDSVHYRRMMESGLEQDIHYCLTLNRAPVVGIYRDGIIRRLDRLQRS